MKWHYYDDDMDAALDLAHRLETAGFTVEPKDAPTDLADLSDELPSGFLVDLDLSTQRHYLGGTLGAALRELAGDIPIVLLTRENIVDGRTETELLDELGAFDDVRFKHRLEMSPDSERQRLVGLALAFKRLSDGAKKGEDLLDVIGPPTVTDRARIVEAGLPVLGGRWTVPIVSRWMLRIILRFPGVLLDDLHASVALGIAVSELERDPVLAILDGALYRGPFAIGRRWWKQALLEIAARRTVGRSGPLYLRFHASLEAELGGVAHAPCVDCGEPADSVCFVLNAPVRTAHSLSYFPDSRPAVMDVARVSFLAIRTNNAVRVELIDPNASAIVHGLLGGTSDA